MLIFYAFDLLHLNGKDLRFRPLLEQRAELKKLIARDTKGCRVGCILPGICRTLTEGVGSKLTSSPYRSGMVDSSPASCQRISANTAAFW
jgi:bifunctional non-homologous end joining protein LigD